MKIELQQDITNTKIISWDSQPGLVYRLEQSSDLVTWNLLQQIVADSTNTSIYAFDEGPQFFRLSVDSDDRIQFPNWVDYVEQEWFFDSMSPWLEPFIWSSIPTASCLGHWPGGERCYELPDCGPVI